MAIERVYIQNNTSIIADEVLSHRLGLLPIYADPRKFASFSDSITDRNTIVFKLKCMCPKNGSSGLFSKDISWVPQGNQVDMFKLDPIRLVHDDIIIAKLAPGQEIDIELHAIKGCGKDHAKWSPVCI